MVQWGSAKPPRIYRPIFDGKISTARETIIVSHAIARLEIVELHGRRDAFVSCLPLNREELEALGLLGVNPFTQ